MNFRRPKAWIEKVIGTQVAVGASRVMGHLADIPLSKRVQKPVTDIYTMAMDVDGSDTVLPDSDTFAFNQFFGRTLESGARPIDPDPEAVTSPCDGRIVATGQIEDGDIAFSIKKSRYSVASLLGSHEQNKTFSKGTYAVIYLHPRDYHRVHVPFDAALTATRHIPGTRFPVTSWCEKLVDNIYDKNERMVFVTTPKEGATLAVIMVAAMGVGNMETPYDPGADLNNPVYRERRFDPSVPLTKGDELGAFLVGSTVVILGSEGAFELDDLEWGPVQMGQRIGKCSLK